MLGGIFLAGIFAYGFKKQVAAKGEARRNPSGVGLSPSCWNALQRAESWKLDLQERRM